MADQASRPAAHSAARDQAVERIEADAAAAAHDFFIRRVARKLLKLRYVVDQMEQQP